MRGAGKLRGASTDAAVVETVTVMLLPGLPGLGDTAHVDSEAGSVQLKLTLWLNPPSLPTAKV
jgi:hypothetical protein